MPVAAHHESHVDRIDHHDHAQLGNERAAWFTDSGGNVLCLHEVMG
ncbi:MULTISPECIES: hypothetical protein [Amycolatopsis]|nr:hypothetical protein [Amycolatopsis bullii]